MAFTMDKTFSAPNQLSDVQTQTLMLVFSSPSPVVAQSTVRSNDKTSASADALLGMGLIRQTEIGIEITDEGIAMLDAVNVVDKTGQRTPYGEEEFAKAVELTARNPQQMEGAWPLISSVLQRV